VLGSSSHIRLAIIVDNGLLPCGLGLFHYSGLIKAWPNGSCDWSKMRRVIGLGEGLAASRVSLG
jgi:hypothetical protein